MATRLPPKKMYSLSVLPEASVSTRISPPEPYQYARDSEHGYVSLELHLCSESENHSALRSSAHVRVILDYRLKKEHW